MVFVSSMGSRLVAPGLICYCSSKSFTSGVARSLSRELEGKVDIIDFCPSYVATNIISDYSVPSIWQITAERASQVCLRDLGNVEKVHGSFRHWFWNNYFFLLANKHEWGRVDLLKQMHIAWKQR